MPSKKKVDVIAGGDDAQQTVIETGDGAQGLIDDISDMLQPSVDGTGDMPLDEAADVSPTPDSSPPGEDAPVKAKPKKAAPKRKTKVSSADEPAPPVDDTADDVSPAEQDDTPLEAAPDTEQGEAPGDDDPDSVATEVDGMLVLNAEPPEKEKKTKKAPAEAPKPRKPAPRPKRTRLDVLKIDATSVIETPEDAEDIHWHDIHNAYRTRRIMTGEVSAVEPTESGETRAIIAYKNFRIAMTMDEMNIVLPEGSSHMKLAPNVRRKQILDGMLYSEVDFIVRGINSRARSIVASRRDAMLKKRQLFYINPGPNGGPRIYEGRIVEARVVAVTDRSVRVEVFGAECSILNRDLSWEWIGDAREYYAIGQRILVRIKQVRFTSAEDLTISADVRSVHKPDGSHNLEKCKVQGKYAGNVIAVNRGVVMVRLSIGVNAIAHSCFDRRMPGKKDDVSFVVTHIEEEREVALGIITRIIRQNL